MLTRDEIGKNLKYLRDKHGESQDELSKATGLNKPKISNWENGKEEPGKEKIEIICNHYSISMHDFMNVKLYEEDVIDFKIEDENAFNIGCITINNLPIIKSEDALKNIYFKAGYDCFKKCKRNLKKDFDESIIALMVSQKLFEDSYKKNKCIEGLVNSTLLLTIMNSVNNKPWVINKKYSIDDLEKLSCKEFNKKYMLKNKEDMQKVVSTEQKNNLIKSNTEIDEAISEITKYDEYKDIALFIMCLRYTQGFSYTGLEYFDSQKMLGELMSVLYVTNNKYVKNLAKLIEKLVFK